MERFDEFSALLGIERSTLEHLERDMNRRLGVSGVLDAVYSENEQAIGTALTILNSGERSATHIKSLLRQKIFSEEKNLIGFLNGLPGKDQFDRAAGLARRIARVGTGMFLKKDRAADILRARPPEHVLEYLNAKNIEELLLGHDVAEVFAALRFMESDAWMHETFEVAYSAFVPGDFEEREIEVRVLGPEWQEVAKRFVAHKHHNVSHLKEFGIIFLNPIEENMPGKFLRDFALLFHYFHEIEFYSKLFRAAAGSDFAKRLKSLLRGDVRELSRVKPGEWLIVQRYLAKDRPDDPRLFVPHVNPESLHWSRGERDLALFTAPGLTAGLKLWNDLDWVGGIFPAEGGKDISPEVVSFDLEDNAMSLVSFMEGKNESFNYHQKEALWTKIFMAYAGGEEKTEELLIRNFGAGVVQF